MQRINGVHHITAIPFGQYAKRTETFLVKRIS